MKSVAQMQTEAKVIGSLGISFYVLPVTTPSLSFPGWADRQIPATSVKMTVAQHLSAPTHISYA